MCTFVVVLFSDLRYFCLQGCSITITSLTDFLAFMIGASTVSFCLCISYSVCLFVILNNYKFIDMLNWLHNIIINYMYIYTQVF